MTGLHRPDLEFAEVGALGEVQLATMGSRLAARLADLLIVFAVTYFPFDLFITGLVPHTFAVLVTFTLYEAILTARTGTPPGKRLLRIKVVDSATGAPPGWGSAVLRAVVMGASVWIISVVVAFSDEKRHRGLHDLAGRTVVIAA